MRGLRAADGDPSHTSLKGTSGGSQGGFLSLPIGKYAFKVEGPKIAL